MVNKRPWLKKLLLIVLLLIVAGSIGIYLIFTEKFDDTGNQTAAFTITANDLIKEFQHNDSAANKKYAEKIIIVNGKIAEKEAADTTINIKMMDTLTGSYIIFAFQEQHVKEAKQLNQGDVVSIKGSCSGGLYSKILETEFISFKRCAVNK
jgi:hypothetical protein